jgi:magnesium transporter
MFLALTVSLSLYATIIIAQSVGCLLPIGAKKIGLDPAVAASPIITTIVDACALTIYFTIAKIFLGL